MNEKIETFKCIGCGTVVDTTRGKLSFDIECVNPKCYGTMYIVKDK
jgi:hypothetical protein